MIMLHQIHSFDYKEILVDILESLINPWMLIPVVMLLSFNSGQILKSRHYLAVRQIFEVLKSK